MLVWFLPLFLLFLLIGLPVFFGLSGGQRSVVLRADGDNHWFDTYVVFKRNRNSVGENITVNNGDNCMSAGPISINNGNTVTIADGGSWSIV